MPKRGRPKPDSERAYTRGNSNEAGMEKSFVENKILPFPKLREIPEPALPLNPLGRKKYDEIVRVLYESGRLTEFTQTQAEHIALQHQSAALDIEKRGVTSASRLDQIRKAMQEIGIDRITKPISTPEKPHENPFANNGFASRRPVKKHQD